MNDKINEYYKELDNKNNKNMIKNSKSSANFKQNKLSVEINKNKNKTIKSNNEK